MTVEAHLQGSSQTTLNGPSSVPTLLNLEAPPKAPPAAPPLPEGVQPRVEGVPLGNDGRRGLESWALVLQVTPVLTLLLREGSGSEQGGGVWS